MTSRIFGGFDQLSSSIGRQIMTGQSYWQYCGFAVLKGSKVHKICYKSGNPEHSDFPCVGFHGHFCKMTLAPLHLSLKIRKKHENSGF